MTELRTSLASPTATKAQRVAAVELTKKDLTELVAKMSEILKLMEGLQNLNKLIEELVKVEREEELLERLTGKLYRDLLKRILEGKEIP